jgi:hypothetical protein
MYLTLGKSLPITPFHDPELHIASISSASSGLGIARKLSMANQHVALVMLELI